MSKREAQFEIYPAMEDDPDGDYQWRLRAANGKIILPPEAYEGGPRKARAAIERVRRAAATARTVVLKR